MNPSPSAPTDAALAVATAAGDRAALAGLFDRYGTNVLGLAQSMLRHRADAEDCLQDVFVLAATRIGGLREPAKVKSWLLAITRHECLRRLGRRREVPVAEPALDQPAPAADDPAALAHGRELDGLIRAAVAGLSARDRLVLDLVDRQGLSTEEVGDALALPTSSAYKVLVRARRLARSSIGALLVARYGRRDCPDLQAILGEPPAPMSRPREDHQIPMSRPREDHPVPMTTLLRKRIARHVEDCATCSALQRRVATPAVLLGLAGAVAIPVGLRTTVLGAAGHAQQVALTGYGTAGGVPAGPSTPAGTGGPSSGGPAGSGGPPTPTHPIANPASEQWPTGWPPADRVATGGSRTPWIAGGSAAAVAGVVALVFLLRPDHPLTPGTAIAAGPVPVASIAGSTTAPPPPTTAGSSEPAASGSLAVPTPAAPPPGTKSTPTTPTTARTTTASTTASGPQITVFEVDCVATADGRYADPYLTWATRNAVRTALSIDNPGIVGSYGGYGPAGTIELPPQGCDPTADTQIYTLYAYDQAGNRVEQTIRWDPAAAVTSTATTTDTTTSTATTDTTTDTTDTTTTDTTTTAGPN